MSDYRLRIAKHHGVVCLRVMIDGEGTAETYIPLDELQRALQGCQVQFPYKGISRIKIRTGSTMKVSGDNRSPSCSPDFITQSWVTDAETGQVLSFVQGIEIISTVSSGTIVKLIVSDVELDCHIRECWPIEEEHREEC